MCLCVIRELITVFCREYGVILPILLTETFGRSFIEIWNMAEASQTRNLDFKLLSLNTRGLREFSKRKSIINWSIKQKADIIFFQETYGTPACEREWK